PWLFKAAGGRAPALGARLSSFAAKLRLEVFKVDLETVEHGAPVAHVAGECHGLGDLLVGGAAVLRHLALEPDAVAARNLRCHGKVDERLHFGLEHRVAFAEIEALGDRPGAGHRRLRVGLEMRWDRADRSFDLLVGLFGAGLLLGHRGRTGELYAGAGDGHDKDGWKYLLQV